MFNIQWEVCLAFIKSALQKSRLSRLALRLTAEENYYIVRGIKA